MRFNDRAMALAGIPDLPVDAFKKEGGKIKLHGGGGGPTTTKSETSNIPEYARPYVERMMGATEKQVYTYGDKGNITGFQPYKPFEGETVAGFTPMQRQAMQGIGGYQLPGQTGAATQMTGYAGLGSMGAGGRYEQQATNPYATQAYMSPYMENALAPQMREAARQSAIQGQQNQAQAVQAGAFGGSRQAIVEAERQRNLGQQQADIYGRGMQSAFEQARQAQQFGAELGLKGYGQGLQAAGQMGALGQQQYGQEMGLLGQQMEIGGKQQQYEQARLNQIIQDYATQQQYPFIQLGTLSNMLRGLPMQASTTQMYQAQPPALQQAVGLAGAGANLYQAMKAEGGAIKEMASGGIASGADPYKLPGMMKKLSDKQLGGKLDQKDTDPETMGIAQAEKQRRDQVRAGVTKMAGGGAVAFAKGGTDEVDNPFNKVKPEDKEVKPEVKKEVKPAPKAAPAKASVSATPYQDMARAQLAALDTLPPEVENVRSSVKELEKRTAGGVEGEMDRQQKLRERFGVDPTKLIAEERARHQEELKLSEEDYRKAQHLRYAQMFARFGSTPGPVLKAALVSINDVVPDLLDDKAKANAVRREIKKAMFELDKSEYQEKKGNLDAASKSHEEAVGRITSLNMELGKMVTETGLKKADITGGMAKSEIAAISGEKQTAMSSSATRYAADKREAGENKRAEIREAAEQRKAKEYENKVTAMTRAELREYDKANKEALDRANEMLSLPDNADSKLAKDQARITKARIEQERREKIMVLQQQYPESRIGQELERGGSGGDVDRSNPLLAK
jgi:hypothetical protein